MKITHLSIYQIASDGVFDNVNSYKEMNDIIKLYGEEYPEDYNNRVGMSFESQQGIGRSDRVLYDDTVNFPMDSVMIYLLQNGNKIDSTQTDITGFYQFIRKSNGTYNISASTHKSILQFLLLKADRVQKPVRPLTE